MLTITRRKGERILVLDKDGTIIGTIEVRQVQGNKVRIGLVFPRELTIIRSELEKETDK